MGGQQYNQFVQRLSASVSDQQPKETPVSFLAKACVGSKFYRLDSITG